MFSKFVHSDRLKALLHALPYFFGGYAHIFRAKSHILLHNLPDNLIIRVLEHHAGFLADEKITKKREN